MNYSFTNETLSKMAKYLYIAFFLTSFISHTFNERNAHILLSRLTFADVFGLLALLCTIPAFINLILDYRKIPRIYLSGGLLVLGFAITAIFSLFPLITFIECVIILFLLSISLGIYLTFREAPLSQLLSYFMWGVILFTAIGFYDQVAEQYNYARIFPVAKYPGVFISGFKNTGQAGSFFMIMFILLLPLRFSKMKQLLAKKRLWLLNVSLICCVLSLFSLGKYSVIFGLIIGIPLFMLYTRKKIVIISFISVIVFLVGFTIVLKVALPQTYNRIGFKFENRVVKNELNTKETGFIKENFTAAFTAFKDHPFTGCGLATFQCTYHTHEIHSTYLKIMGEAGLIGMFVYLIFMFNFLRLFPISWKQEKDPFIHYLQCLFPLVLGALITWIYTYHLRKREFWILVAVVLIVVWRSKNSEINLQN